MRKLFGWLASSWRFGRAGRLQAAGDYERALQLYGRIRSTLAANPPSDASGVSLWLMSLARLAEVSLQLGRHDVAKEALEEWMHVRDSECRQHPGFATVPALVKWEKWVRANMARIRDSSSPI